MQHQGHADPPADRRDAIHVQLGLATGHGVNRANGHRQGIAAGGADKPCGLQRIRHGLLDLPFRGPPVQNLAQLRFHRYARGVRHAHHLAGDGHVLGIGQA
jgi:hypothetical protein